MNNLVKHGSQILPRVSIVMPSYNQGDFLEQAIQSVLSQGYPNLEYIIIDGGSTDNSVDIIKRYSANLSYWISQKDDGQADAINNGFKRATGKYVAWLNSDDIYLPGCIQKAVEILESNPDAGMVFGQVEVVNDQGNHIGMFRPITYQFEDLLTYKIIVPQQAAFLRRNILDEVGMLDVSFHFALDHEFFLRIGRTHPIMGIPDTLAQYRLSEINKGTVMRSKWAEELVRIIDKFFSKPEESQKYQGLKEKAYAGAYYNGACSLLDDGLYILARHWYLIAIRHQLIHILRVKWWINFIRTFIGKRGNEHYVNLKAYLAKSGHLDARYDWWSALRLLQDKTNKL